MEAMTPPETRAPALIAGPFRLLPFAARTLPAHVVGDSRRLVALASRRRALPPMLGDVATPALFLHEYRVEGRTVRGLVGLLDLSTPAPEGTRPDEAVVVPHELVSLPRAALLADQMRHLRMQPAPLLLTAEYPSTVRSVLDRVSGQPAEHSFLDHHGHQHRIWRLVPTDESIVRDALRDTRALLADGHHRYAAYLGLAADGHAAQGLVMLVDAAAGQLRAGGIHRVLTGITATELLECLAGEAVPADRTARPHAHELVIVSAESAWLVRTPPDLTPVEHLHDRTSSRTRAMPIAYVHEAEEALSLVDREHVAVLLPDWTPDELWTTLRRRPTLPEKSTSFQPKPPVGALMATLD